MTQAERFEIVLVHLLEWASGNRGSKHNNPYSVPEIKAALTELGHHYGMRDYLDVNKSANYQAIAQGGEGREA